MSDTLRDDFVEAAAKGYQEIRDKRAGNKESALLTLAQAREHGFKADFDAYPPVAPNTLGTQGFPDWPLQDLVTYIDWKPFFRPWELEGNTLVILDYQIDW